MLLSKRVHSATEHSMKVKIIRNVMVAGVRKDSGSTIEVENHVGALLIGLGKAEEVTKEKPAPKPAAKKEKPAPAPAAATPAPEAKVKATYTKTSKPKTSPKGA